VSDAPTLAQSARMVLFPLAAIWVVAVVVWAIRKGVFQPPPPPGTVRRKPPRKPKPHDRRDGARPARGRASRRARRQSAER
jgi:hypothetical protein